MWSRAAVAVVLGYAACTYRTHNQHMELQLQMGIALSMEAVGNYGLA